MAEIKRKAGMILNTDIEEMMYRLKLYTQITKEHDFSTTTTML